MGTDIHWTIERYHPDGHWEAVLDKSGEWARALAGSNNFMNLDLTDPGIAFGQRDYSWFGLLSGVRENEEDETLCTPGMPDDASPYALDAMEWEMNSDLYGHGWIDLASLRRAITATPIVPFLEDEEVRDRASVYLNRLETILMRSGPQGPTSVIRGRRYDPDTEIYHPDMARLSAHERLALLDLEQRFGPLEAENIRLLVAYDN